MLPIPLRVPNHVEKKEKAKRINKLLLVPRIGIVSDKTIGNSISREECSGLGCARTNDGRGISSTMFFPDIFWGCGVASRIH
jgi:hypothetical protein